MAVLRSMIITGSRMRFITNLVSRTRSLWDTSFFVRITLSWMGSVPGGLRKGMMVVAD